MTVLKSVEGCRFLKRGAVLPPYIHLSTLKGLLRPVAEARGLPDTTQAIIDEYVRIEMVPGSPVIVP
ncbi:MAG: hypothetical protein AABZ64_07345 [Nitrospinota bacterium]